MSFLLWAVGPAFGTFHLFHCTDMVIFVLLILLFTPFTILIFIFNTLLCYQLHVVHEFNKPLHANNRLKRKKQKARAKLQACHYTLPTGLTFTFESVPLKIELYSTSLSFFLPNIMLTFSILDEVNHTKLARGEPTLAASVCCFLFLGAHVPAL